MNGYLLALASAAAFAVASNCIARARAAGGDKGVFFSILVTVGLSALLWLAGGDGFSGLTATGTGWFVAAGLGAMVFGRSLLFRSVQTLGVARATAVKRLNPFFSVLLAAAILGEAIRWPDVAGMIAIAAGFAVLIRADLAPRRGGGDPVGISAYGSGVAAALAYSLAYIARKLGLDASPAAAFGTLVSALTGLFAFLALGLVSSQARANLRGVLRNLTGWIVAASIAMASGQILMFAALARAPVSGVVMVASLEIFLSLFLARTVFRTEAAIGPAVLIAAVLATAGVILVAA